MQKPENWSQLPWFRRIQKSKNTFQTELIDRVYTGSVAPTLNHRLGSILLLYRTYNTFDYLYFHSAAATIHEHLVEAMFEWHTWSLQSANGGNFVCLRYFIHGHSNAGHIYFVCDVWRRRLTFLHGTANPHQNLHDLRYLPEPPCPRPKVWHKPGKPHGHHIVPYIWRHGWALAPVSETKNNKKQTRQCFN